MRNYLLPYYTLTTRGRLQKYLIHKGFQIPHQSYLNKLIYELTYKIEEMYIEGPNRELDVRTKEFAKLIHEFYLKEKEFTNDYYCTRYLIKYIPDKCNDFYWSINTTPITKSDVEEWNT